MTVVTKAFGTSRHSAISSGVQTRISLAGLTPINKPFVDFGNQLPTLSHIAKLEATEKSRQRSIRRAVALLDHLVQKAIAISDVQDALLNR